MSKSQHKEKILYNGIELDSEEELWLCHWLDELKKFGYVAKWSKVTTALTVLDAASMNFLTGKGIRSGKEKFTRHVQSLMDLKYTPDFDITWGDLSEGLLHVNLAFLEGRRSLVTSGPLSVYAYTPEYTTTEVKLSPFVSYDGRSIVDTKGDREQFIARDNRSMITFPLIRKILWSEQRLLVNKIIPVDLFKKTFVPLSLLKTKHGKSRKFNFPVRVLSEYLESMSS